MLKMLQACIHGLEINFVNSGSGGIASVFYLLEIAHTHYWSKDGCDSSTSGFDSQVWSMVDCSKEPLYITFSTFLKSSFILFRRHRVRSEVTRI